MLWLIEAIDSTSFQRSLIVGPTILSKTNEIILEIKMAIQSFQYGDFDDLNYNKRLATVSSKKISYLFMNNEYQG